MFTTHPYGELGVPEVARAIGITAGLVYHRLALRAYMGFLEHAMVQWLEQKQVARATLETMCRTMMIAALRVGLSSDSSSRSGAQQLALLEQACQQRFSTT